LAAEGDGKEKGKEGEKEKMGKEIKRKTKKGREQEIWNLTAPPCQNKQHNEKHKRN